MVLLSCSGTGGSIYAKLANYAPLCRGSGRNCVYRRHYRPLADTEEEIRQLALHRPISITLVVDRLAAMKRSAEAVGARYTLDPAMASQGMRARSRWPWPG